MKSTTETIFDTPQSFMSILAFNSSNLSCTIIYTSKECLKAIIQFDKDISTKLRFYPNLLLRYKKIRHIIIAFNQRKRKSYVKYVKEICNGSSRGF